MITIFYNVSSNFKFLYFEIKNEYAKDDKYLAVVTENGLWIRDKIDKKTSYINAEKLENDNLLNVSISQFDENFILENLIISERAIIKDKNWLLKNVVIALIIPLKNLNNLNLKVILILIRFLQFLKIFLH